MKIKRLTARQIIDSRGIPTLEVTAYSSKTSATFGVPSGASTGSFEACELRDGNMHEYFGKSVKKAVNHVNGPINKLLTKKNALYQKEIDSMLIDFDNTDDKSHMGANAILGASLAIAKLVAKEEKIPLFKYIRALYDPYIGFKLGSDYRIPIPMFNMINGGAHADNDISAQEFMVIPAKSRSMQTRVRIAAEINHSLKEILKDSKESTALGDEGGYAALATKLNGLNRIMTDTESLFQTLIWATKNAGYVPGQDVFYGMDVAVSRFLKDAKDSTYKIPNWTQDGDFEGNFDELLNTYGEIAQKYPILLIEDPAHENDWQSWVKIKKSLGKDIYIVGDDLTVTNPKRLQKAVLLDCINSIIIKPNQIGTLSEVFETCAKAHDNNIDIIVSHRSGETTDDFIADLAVGMNAKFYKGGNLMRGERVAKYNRLLEIEEML